MPVDRNLRGTPVVVLGDSGLVPLVVAGAVRANSDATVLELLDETAEMLLDGARHAEVLVVASTAPIALLGTIRTLGGRGLPVLDVDGDGAPTAVAVALLNDPRVSDLNLAVPVIGDAARPALWDPLRAAGVEDHHQLVEVDGRAALDASGTEAGGTVRELAAGAAGVLAGRLAAANRRWRSELRS